MWPFRAIRFLLHIGLGLLIVMLIFPLVNEAGRINIERWYSRKLLGLFRITPVLNGTWPDMPGMLVLNHISWLDIFAVNSQSPSIFIAKSEIASWPLAGKLVSAAGTLFIERGRRQAVHRVIKDAEGRMRDGRQVAVCPEGTTTDGSGLATFHANMFQAAINAGVPLIPVALRYTDESGMLSTDPAFVGEQTMLQNVMILWKSRKRYTVTLVPCEPIYQPDWTRHHYSDACRQAILSRLSELAG